MKFTPEQIKKAIDKLRFRFPYSAEEWADGLYMENYHCHKDFSNSAVPDCAESIENYALRSKVYGSKCLFSGDHGSQGNQFKVYKVAEQYELKYRHSAEAYWVKDRHQKDRTNCHIMLIAKNPEGRKDINYVLSKANEDGFYYQPRIDLELLLSMPAENVIVTSACVAAWKYEDADDIWLKIANHFKDNFFLEIQTHLTDKQRKLNKHLLELAKKHNLQIICGLDSHYVDEANAIKREQIQKYKHVEYNDDESGWFMDWPDTETVIQRLHEQGVLSDEEILESILNTNIFVDECEEIVFDRHFKIPNIYKELDYEGRVKLFKRKLNKCYKVDPIKSSEKAKGIKWEVEQLVDSGVVDYPLLTERIIKDAVEKFGGVLTTTSRGSAASFVTNKYMGITTIDRFNAEVPIYPERFLTKDRVMGGQMPDCDLNLSKQEPFVKATRNLLGEHGCYPLMTLQTLKEKAAWQLYAGANDVLPEKAREVSKALDAYNKRLKHADENEKDDIRVEEYIPSELVELYQQSKEYQGITIGIGSHACGHLLLDKDIRREIGLISAKSETTGERTLCAAVEGIYLDEFGYVKEDFLIVDSVALTDKLFRALGEPVPSFDELKRMVENDPLTWGIYSKGITCSVNQCEKESTRQKAMKYKPQNIAELTSFVAGIRPGFASLVDRFLARKPYTTGEPEIDTLLDDSAHYMIYQESIMKVLGFLGVPMTETYGVIKAISKKKLKGEKKEKLLTDLKDGWMKKFGNLDNFSKIWKVIEDSAAYGFNCCVSGDTKILKGSSNGHKFDPTIEEMYLIKNDIEYAKKTNHLSLRSKYHTYGYGSALSMFGDGKIRVNKIVDIRESGTQDIYRVTTASGAFVDCTMNHKFPTPDRGEVKLEDLKVGDSLYVKGITKRCQEEIPTHTAKIVSIEYLRTDKTYDIEMADPAHNFITESGLVVSNSHAYSMSGDSLYLAWFKAHHTKTFYEVAISHYQEKGKKDKIDALIKEAMKYYGYRYGTYEFGADNRQVTLDDENKIIYPNLTSIKGFGEGVVQVLYECGLKEYSSFYEVLKALSERSVNSTLISNLIKIGYFSQFGSIKKLLKLQFYWGEFGNAKRVSFKKIEKLGLNVDDFIAYGRPTSSTIMDFKKEDFLEDMELLTDEEEPSLAEQVKWQIQILGMTTIIDESQSHLFVITNIEPKMRMSILNLYKINSGTTATVKCWNSELEGTCELGDIVKIGKFDKRIVREFSGEYDADTGKKIYAPVEGKYEYWVSGIRSVEC